MILDKSSFYAKAGCQEADLSIIAFKGRGELIVSNIQTYGGYALHSGVISDGGDCPKPWKVPNLTAGLSF